MLKAGNRKSAGDGDLSIKIKKDRRRYFRVSPDRGKPIYFEDDRKKYPVTEICAGGLAFVAGRFSPGKRFQGRLTLPDQALAEQITLEAVRPVREKVIGAKIIRITEEDRELIHAYVHQRQKEDLEKVRTKPPE